MKTSVLISRLIRAIETGGEIGNGATFASDYNIAVQKVNGRLEAVQVALDASQFSDAARLIEESPPLLEEIGVLDFQQLPAWRLLCQERGWDCPVPIAHSLLEKILFVYNSSAMLQPVLRQYRKAVRLRDEGKIVKCLRRLAEIDPSTDWRSDLEKAEAALRESLLASFRSARTSGKSEEADCLAERLLAPDWSTPLDQAVLDEATSYKNERARKKELSELQEDLEILRALQDVWDGKKARSILDHLDSLNSRGVPVPSGDVDLVQFIRKKYEREAEKLRAAQERNDLVVRLHAAVEHENPDEVRRVLADPAFIGCPPDEVLFKKARQVISHAEDQKSRKVRLIVGTLSVLLIFLLLTSLFFFKEKSFAEKRDRYDKELAWIAKGTMAHVNLSNALEKVKQDPDAERLSVLLAKYDGQLSILCREREARLGKISIMFQRLQKYQDGGWLEDPSACEAQFRELNKLILPEEVDLSKKLAEYNLAFLAIQKENHENRVKAASLSLENIEQKTGSELALLGTCFLGADEIKRLSVLKANIDRWEKLYGNCDANLDGRREKLSRDIALTEKSMTDAQGALERLRDASTLDDILQARSSLVNFYKKFQGVASLSPLPVSEDVMRSFCAGNAPAQMVWRRFSIEPSQDFRFNTFLEKEVLIYNDSPEIRSLYGIYHTSPYSRSDHDYQAYSIGKAVMNDLIGKTQVGEDVITADNFERVTQVELPRHREESIVSELLPSSLEISDVLDYASAPGITASDFRDKLYSKIGKHLGRVVPAAERSLSSRHFMKIGSYPGYRKIQLISLYVKWLEMMGVWPKVPSASMFKKKCCELAAPITIDGVEAPFTWLCLNDQRIRERNAQCDACLASVPAETGERWKKSLRSCAALSAIHGWEIIPVGNTAFVPDATARCSWHYFGNADRQAPLYVFRNDSHNRTFLMKVAVPHGKRHGRLENAKMAQGEPLFQVFAGGKAIDVMAEYSKIYSHLDSEIRRQIPVEGLWFFPKLNGN